MCAGVEDVSLGPNYVHQHTEHNFAWDKSAVQRKCVGSYDGSTQHAALLTKVGVFFPVEMVKVVVHKYMHTLKPCLAQQKRNHWGFEPVHRQ